MELYEHLYEGKYFIVGGTNWYTKHPAKVITIYKKILALLKISRANFLFIGKHNEYTMVYYNGSNAWNRYARW